MTKEPVNIGDLYDDDFLEIGLEKIPTNDKIIEEELLDKQPIDQEPPKTQEERNIIAEALKFKNISDMNSIKFENEEGEIEEKSWSDLSFDEQLNILNSSDLDNNYGLEDEELDLINAWRETGMSTSEYIDNIKQQAVNEYLNKTSSEQFQVDVYTDEELFLADLQIKIGDLTEEELEEILLHEKSNETLFAKKVTALRNEYIEAEKAQLEEQRSLLEAEKNKEVEQFNNNIVASINSFTNLGELDMDLNEEEKNSIFEHITGVDQQGVPNLQKVLSNPESLTKAMWFILYGDQAIKEMSTYYKDQIKQSRKAETPKPASSATLHTKPLNKQPETVKNSVDSIWELEN